MAQRTTLRAVPDLPVTAEPGGLLAEPLPPPGLRALVDEAADLRDAVFSLGDIARRALPVDADGVHVALQIAAHQLGEVERLLRDCA